MKYLLLCFLLVGCCEPCPEGKKIYKIVVEVGGCDRYGDCSVIYDDGTVSRDVYRPVKGEKRYIGCRK